MLWGPFRWLSGLKTFASYASFCFYFTFSGQEPKKSFIPEVPGSLLEFAFFLKLINIIINYKA